MSRLHTYIEAIWWRSQRPPCWLRLFEPLYALISRRHLQKRAAGAVQPPLPMISVGNITVGGSGKTPFVLWLAEALAQRGRRPVIMCRGDGGTSDAVALIDASVNAFEVGDEACMLAQQAQCPVIAAQDRIAGSRLAADLGDVLILDDGFQYRHLARCCDIVLVPAAGVGNGHFVGAGPLREPLATLMRADIVIRTASRSIERVTPLSDQMEWQWLARAGDLVDMRDCGEPIPEQLLAATAIARPQRFFEDLKGKGLHLTEARTWPDHYRFTAQDVESLLQPGLPVAVTAKDAVKLQQLWPADKPLWVLQQFGEAEPDLLECVIDMLPERTDAE